MPELHLISHHLCPYVQRAVIVLLEKGITHRRTYIDLANKPDWFGNLSPLGRVPILQTGEGVLFESQVIAEYLDEVTKGTMHPADAFQKARHRAWIEFGSATLAGIAGFYSAKTPEVFERNRVELRGRFERLEAEIAGPFFAGENFHMIDGVWGTIFRYFNAFDKINDFGILSGLPKLASWRAALAARPSVIAAPPEGYDARLLEFVKTRGSHLTSLMPTN